MAAFDELGSMHVIEQITIYGCVKLVVRSSNIPASMRTLGFDVDAVEKALVEYVNTGRKPADPRALLFLSA